MWSRFLYAGISLPPRRQKANFVGGINEEKIYSIKYLDFKNNTTKLPRHFAESTALLRGSFFIRIRSIFQCSLFRKSQNGKSSAIIAAGAVTIDTTGAGVTSPLFDFPCSLILFT